ncbi:MAG TPA: glycosyltransferase [Candidatus Saccharimonadales bacterium]|nr:glycosyltransferase [Candidatus Saccharimonadales bacterium]
MAVLNNSEENSFDIIEPGFIQHGQEYIHHSGLSVKDTAFHRLIRKQIIIIAVICALVIIGFILNWHATLLTLVAILTAYYVIQIGFDSFLCYRSLSRDNEIEISTQEVNKYSMEWPKYTILCPLYDEANILPQFVSAMKKLEYPADKLQIMLLLESNDDETIKAAKNMRLGKSFEIVIVPESQPQTKPKALNYGLKRATGEYIVVYDAEDIPEPRQLKQAVLAYQRVEPDVACIQSKLDYYNADQNLLTRLFTAEYASLFSLVLPGLQSIKAPIPLGGTSNHFQKKLLKELGGWDAFNVTEDADLGIRLAKQGFRTVIMNSFTFEEASSRPKNWFKQRCRWIKGYIQTFFVHTRHLREFKSTIRKPNSQLFQMVVGGKVALMFINPIMLLITILYFSLDATIGATVRGFFPAPILYMAVGCILFGNFMYLYYYMLGCAKREHWQIVKIVYLMPFYWLAMSAAAYVAVFELVFRPYYWHKTLHGHHLGVENIEHAALDTLRLDSKIPEAESA